MFAFCGGSIALIKLKIYLPIAMSTSLSSLMALNILCSMFFFKTHSMILAPSHPDDRTSAFWQSKHKIKGKRQEKINLLLGVLDSNTMFANVNVCGLCSLQEPCQIKVHRTQEFNV